MKLYAGYDGGGTKTACVLTDETGRPLGFGVGGPSNYLYCGKEVAAASVIKATQGAFRDAGLPMQRLEIAYMAGAAILLQHGDAHIPFFRSCIDAEQVVCESDIYPIWYGSVGDRPAVVSIAGTGAITYVCSQEGFVRVGGWGPLLGDEGSGYDLGLRGLRLACRMFDGRESLEPSFMEAIFAQYQVSTPGELLRKLNTGDIRSAVAAAAKTICRLYAAGSPAAEKLLNACADEIALAVTAAVSKADPEMEYPLILSGGLVQAASPLCPMLEQRLLQPESRICQITSLQVHPGTAAAALALHHGGLEQAAEALLAQTKGWQL